MEGTRWEVMSAHMHAALEQYSLSARSASGASLQKTTFGGGTTQDDVLEVASNLRGLPATSSGRPHGDQKVPAGVWREIRRQELAPYRAAAAYIGACSSSAPLSLPFLVCTIKSAAFFCCGMALALAPPSSVRVSKAQARTATGGIHKESGLRYWVYRCVRAR